MNDPSPGAQFIPPGSGKRVLLLSHMGIYPANVGNKVRIATLIEQLTDAGHEVWFGGLGLPEAEAAAMRESLGSRFLSAPRVPLRRSRNPVTAFQKAVGVRLAGRGWIVPDIDLWYRDEWDAAIRSWQQEHDFEVVMVEYVFFSRALLLFGPDVLKIIDTHDLFADRYKALRRNGIRRFWFVTDEKQERRGLNRADAIIAIQDLEAKNFRSRVSAEIKVITLGHPVRVEALPPSDPAHSVIAYIGSPNAQNVNAISAFLAKGWPLIHAASPETRLLIAGGVASRIEPAPGVDLISSVEDVREIYTRATVMINPMEVGTGLKIKSIEALGFGRPLVTTAVGAHGLEDAAGHALLVADGQEQTAAALLSVLRDPALRARLGAGALAYARDWNSRQRTALRELIQTGRHSPQPGELCHA